MAGLQTSERERLDARELRVHFKGVHAVDGVDLTVARGEILGLIGPNGAGKTTLVNVLSGFQRPTSGRIFVGGVDVTRWPPYRRARHGLSRTFQNVRLFSSLTVSDNIRAAAVANGLRTRDAARSTDEILEVMNLGPKHDSLAKTLSQGDGRRLGIARSLATRPRFLLLDEPAAGLNETESAGLVEILLGVREMFDCGLIVIEHDMSVIMRLSDRVQVLDYGKTIAVGTPAEVRADPTVLVAYLGTEGASDAGD